METLDTKVLLQEKQNSGLIKLSQVRAMPVIDSKSPFKWRHYQPEIILLNVRWYSRYSLSYRDLKEMMLERGIQVDHG